MGMQLKQYLQYNQRYRVHSTVYDVSDVDYRRFKQQLEEIVKVA